MQLRLSRLVRAGLKAKTTQEVTKRSEGKSFLTSEFPTGVVSLSWVIAFGRKAQLRIICRLGKGGLPQLIRHHSNVQDQFPHCLLSAEQGSGLHQVHPIRHSIYTASYG
jgi:hypothetical protein